MTRAIIVANSTTPDKTGNAVSKTLPVGRGSPDVYMLRMNEATKNGSRINKKVRSAMFIIVSSPLWANA